MSLPAISALVVSYKRGGQLPEATVTDRDQEQIRVATSAHPESVYLYALNKFL